MTWNYRVVKRTFKAGEPGEEVECGIYDAYYELGAAQPHSIGATPSSPVGATPEELRQDIGKMMVAFGKPTLIYEEFDKKAVRPPEAPSSPVSGGSDVAP